MTNKKEIKKPYQAAFNFVIAVVVVGSTMFALCVRLSLLILTAMALKPRKIHPNNKTIDCLYMRTKHTALFGIRAELLESTEFSLVRAVVVVYV